MRPRRPARFLGAVMLVVAMLAVGCTDAPPSATPTDGDARGAGGNGGEDDPAAGNGSAAAGDGNEVPVTPLMEFWGVAAVSLEFDDVEVLRQGRELEEAVAACMAAEGFDYIPWDLGVARGGFDGSPWELPPDEFAARYGYGMTTIDRGQAWADMPEDPNHAIRAAMSDPERAAYDEAMWGPGVQVIDHGGGVTVFAESESGVPERPDPSHGCRNQAASVVFGEPATSARPDGEFEDLVREMSGIWERIERDPRVSAAARLWSDCMADAGYAGLAVPADAPDLVGSRMNEAVGDGENRPAGGGGLFWDDPFESLDPVALQVLREFEMAVAVADLACRGDYDDVLLAVRIDLEQQFVDQHRAELERYRDSGVMGGGVG